MKNPVRAIAAFNAAPAEIAGYKVYPVTLGICGVLDAIDSPLVTGQNPGGISGWTETIYAMTRPTADSLALLAGEDGREAFREAALRWADSVPAGVALSLMREANRQAHVAMGVNPEPDSDGEPGKNSLAATAG